MNPQQQGANQLNITAAQVSQQAPGRLFSGGNLLLHSNGFDQTGQVESVNDETDGNEKTPVPLAADSDAAEWVIKNGDKLPGKSYFKIY